VGGKNRRRNVLSLMDIPVQRGGGEKSSRAHYFEFGSCLVLKENV